MSDVASPPLAPTTRTYFLRRVLARLIDDALLVGISIMITVNAFIATNDGEEGILYGSPDLSGDASALVAPTLDGMSVHPASALLITGLLATLFFVAYAALSAATGGATLGRAITGLRIVSEDGTRPPARVVAGRECIRVALIGVALAAVGPATEPLARAGAGLASDSFGVEVSQVATAMASLLPLGLVAVGLAGAAFVHPTGRSLHDRWSGTRVVRTQDRVRPAEG